MGLKIVFMPSGFIMDLVSNEEPTKQELQARLQLILDAIEEGDWGLPGW